jgi:hypothetical protein
MNVKLIRMWSGEDVLADLVGDLTDSVVLRNPIVAIPAGQGQMGFAPWSPLLKGKDVDLEVTKKYVVYIAEAQEQIVEQYEEMFSVIKAPSKKLIM